MNIHRIFAVYFSPAGSTRRICTTMARAAADRLGAVSDTIDFTAPSCRVKTHAFGPGDLVFFGTPVYAGRVPNILLPYLKTGFSGNGAAVVPFVSYGGRAYDDALYELTDLLKRAGFLPAAAAAVPARHAMRPDINADRPGADDLAALRGFAVRISDRISADAYTPPALDIPCPGGLTHYYTPAAPDGTPVNFLRSRPAADPALCEGCCMCAVLCPMGAIPRGEPMTTTGTCIHCQACILRCPRRARSLSDPGYLAHLEALPALCAGRKEPEWFT